MSEVYVLDACALIALLTREAGSETVRARLRSASMGKAHILMHKLNLLEVYYGDYRAHGEIYRAAKTFTNIVGDAALGVPCPESLQS